MAQASLFLVVSLGVVSLGDSLSGAATGFAIWLEPFVDVHENNDENIVLYCIVYIGC
jgi:hypothetical protein